MNSEDRYWIDNEVFKEYRNACGGDKFAAVRCIAKSARKLAKESEYAILDSSALAAILRKKHPKDIERRIKNLKDTEADRVLDNILDYINDMDVLESVIASMKESVKNRNLVYVYNEIKSEDTRARVRILCKIIWEDLHSWRI